MLNKLCFVSFRLSESRSSGFRACPHCDSEGSAHIILDTIHLNAMISLPAIASDEILRMFANGFQSTFCELKYNCLSQTSHDF